MPNSFLNNQPIDSPAVQSPGVKRRESDWQGAGKHVSLPPEHPLRMAKGDFGMVGREPVRTSFEGGGVTLTGGRKKKGR